MTTGCCYRMLETRLSEVFRIVSHTDRSVNVGFRHTFVSDAPVIKLVFRPYASSFSRRQALAAIIFSVVAYPLARSSRKVDRIERFLQQKGATLAALTARTQIMKSVTRLVLRLTTTLYRTKPRRTCPRAK